MIYYNSNTINDWNFGDDNIIKVYRNGAVCYYKITSGDTEIDKGAFSGCTNMGSLTVLPTTPPKLEYAYDTLATMGGTIYVPAASLNTYRNASGWSLLASRIEAIPT